MSSDTKTLTCLIIDDEPLARKILREFCYEVGSIHIVAECHNALTAKPHLENDLDMIFLDINMPMLSGLDFYPFIPKNTKVIFTTADPQHAVEAFELEAFDYLVKPIRFQRFLHTIEKVRRHLSQPLHSEWVTFKEGRRLYKLNPDSITHVQAYGDYVKVFTSEKTYLPKTKLNDFLLSLPKCFLQVHRSYVVNLEKVKYLEGNLIVIDSDKIPVSTSYREKLLARM